MNGCNFYTFLGGAISWYTFDASGKWQELTTLWKQKYLQNDLLNKKNKTGINVLLPAGGSEGIMHDVRLVSVIAVHCDASSAAEASSSSCSSISWTDDGIVQESSILFCLVQILLRF